MTTNGDYMNNMSWCHVERWSYDPANSLGGFLRHQTNAKIKLFQLNKEHICGRHVV